MWCRQATIGIWGGNMDDVINIKKKVQRRGEDGSKVISIRLKNELVDALDAISAESNRSRNELIGILLADAIKRVKISD